MALATTSSLGLQLHAARLSGRKPRRRKRLPRQRDPRKIEFAYFQRLLQLQREFESLIRDDVLPQVRHHLEDNQRALALDGDGRWQMCHVPRQDAPADGSDMPSGRLARLLDDLVRPLLGELLRQERLAAIAREMANRTSQHNIAELARVLEAAIGVPWLPVNEPGLANQVALFVHSNTRLITRMVEEQYSRIEDTILREGRRGTRHKVVAKQVESEFGVGRRRAKVIARDQIASLNGELSQLRQTRLGVTEYTWRHSGDARVRGNPNGKYPRAKPSHWAREGKRYSWRKPPEGGHPGQAVLCRCTAEPVLDDLLEGV